MSRLHKLFAVLSLVFCVAAYQYFFMPGETDASGHAASRASAKKPAREYPAAAAASDTRAKVAGNLPSAARLYIPSARPPMSLLTQDAASFGATSWQAPPAPAPVVPLEAMAKPTPPPVPYSYFGRLRDADGKRITYLALQNELVPIYKDAVLHDTYRVETIAPHEIVLVYLPLQEKQVIQIPLAEEP